MRVRVVSTVLASIVLAACGGTETSESATATAIATAKPGTAATASSGDVDPCAILDQDLIRRHFDVGAAEMDVRPSRRSRHLLCRVIWRKPDAAEIEKQTQAKMSEYMLAKARGEEVKMPSFHTDNDVSLTINMPPLETDEAAASAFQSAMQTLNDGFKDKDNPEAPPKFQYETELVGGVADGAFWTPGLSQLSVRSGRYVFHVTVQTGDAGVNRAKARALASEIAKKLGD